MLICANSLLQSLIIEIKQDSTGDFELIQNGIYAAVHSDTVLVYPGIYFENIDYLGKSITVASTYIMNEADSLISQTVIDGNHEFRCVTIDGCSNAFIIGFTIQNGWAIINSGYNDVGGGIFVIDSSISISNCIIQNNKANYGGGICFWDADCLLSGNTIKYNYAIQGGGGIHERNPNNVLIYNNNNLNNIYLNYASSGSDISCSSFTFSDAIVDTFTTVNANYFHLTPIDNFTFSAQNSKIELLNADLFVSPLGDDNNNGLSPNEPLLTISWAQTIIRSDSLHPNTIHLAEGIYSPSINNQRFPLNINNFVTIKGVDKYTTILDAEHESPLIFFLQEAPSLYLTLKNFTFLNGSAFLGGGGFMFIIKPYHITSLEDIFVSNCNGNESHSIILGKDGEYILKNVDIVSNYGSDAFRISAEFYENPFHYIDVYMENCKFIHNYPDGTDFGCGGALYLYGHVSELGYYNVVLNNFEISDNYNNFEDPGGISGIFLSKQMNARLINSTIGNNITINGTTVAVSTDSNADFINSIIYNNEGSEVVVSDNSNVIFTNSVVQTGLDEIIVDETSSLDWLSPNLDTDPLWLGDGDYPFALSELSPCIDAGTLDLPEGIELPEYDLAGNPRIVGETVDMGAYEFQGTQITNDQLPVTRINMSVYPNPFKPNERGHNSSIKFNLLESCNVDLTIYNMKGQKVKTMMDAYASRGEYNCRWNGSDDNGKPVSSGQYVLKLVVDDETKAVRKMIVFR